jgi:DNA-binding MarR family transcriptional regulator
VPELSPIDYEALLAFRTSLRRFLHWSQSRARSVGLTAAQHQLLVAIKGHPGGQGPTISDLAGYLLLRHHSVVELVDRAEALGVVKRGGDSVDGRLTRVSLTEDGENRLSRLTPAHLNELRNLAPILNQLVLGTAEAVQVTEATQTPEAAQTPEGAQASKNVQASESAQNG